MLRIQALFPYSLFMILAARFIPSNAGELRDLSGESDQPKRKDLMAEARSNPRKKINLDTNRTPFIKINSKWIIDLNVIHKSKSYKIIDDVFGVISKKSSPYSKSPMFSPLIISQKMKRTHTWRAWMSWEIRQLEVCRRIDYNNIDYKQMKKTLNYVWS